MLFLLRAKLTKPDGMSNKEFYGIWQKESEAALAGIEAGVIKVAYKVAGKPEVYAVFEAETADDLDHAVHSLPIWQLGYSHLVTELEWIPLRPYAHWAEDLKKLAQDG
jgi:muconolactone delta-isomerase